MHLDLSLKSTNLAVSQRINIAIDGLSACGKSTLAKDLAEALDYIHIDSGAMYRAITSHMIKKDIDLDDNHLLSQNLDSITLTFDMANDHSILLLNGEQQGENLRTREVDQLVSHVAALPMVRQKVMDQQQNIGNKKGIVMDGRDIGSVIFPHAELKIFLQAELKVRSRRRRAELKQRGIELSELQVIANLKERDQIDSQRKHSPLVKTADAIVIDNSNLNQKEQLAMVLALARCRIE